MELIPVKENLQRWKAMYNKMARGEKADINDDDVQQLSVEGIPPNLTGQGGRLLAPAEAENVVPPPEEEPEIPDTYDQAVAMRPKYNPQRRKPRAQKRKATGRKPRRSATKKRRGNSGRKRGGGRKRSRITKR